MKKIVICLSVCLFVVNLGFAHAENYRERETALLVTGSLYPLLIKSNKKTEPEGTRLVITGGKDIPRNVQAGEIDAPLGVVNANVYGQTVCWQAVTFTISNNTIDGLITNVSLADQNGAILSGPWDPIIGKGGSFEVTLADTVCLSVGNAQQLYLKGNLNNGWKDGETFAISIDPPADFISVTDSYSGEMLVPESNGVVVGKTRTVQLGSLLVAPASSFVSKSVVNGIESVVGQYVTDGTSSGENIRITTMQFTCHVDENSDLDYWHSFSLHDVTNGVDIPLTTGSNIVHPNGHSLGKSDVLTFTLDSPFFDVVKGTQRIVEMRAVPNFPSTDLKPTLRCDFSSGSPDWTVIGTTSFMSVNESLMTQQGTTITVLDYGGFWVSLSPTSPTEKWYVSGEEGTSSVYRFTSTVEGFSVREIPLALMNGEISDISSIFLYQGNTLIKEMTSPAFAENGIQRMYLTPEQLVVPEGDDGVDLGIVVKFSQIGTGLPGTSGNLVRVIIAEPFPVVGRDSGVQVMAQGNPSFPSGARYFKALPRKTLVPLLSTILINGTRELYRHTVTAQGGDIDIYQRSYYVDTNVGVSSCDSVEETTGKTVRSGVSPSPTGLVRVTVNPAEYGSEVITIPEGQTRTYLLSCTVTGAQSGGYVSTMLLEDEGYFGGSLADAPSYVNFLWSDRSAMNHSMTTSGWYGGFGIPYLGYQTLSLIEF